MAFTSNAPEVGYQFTGGSMARYHAATEEKAAGCEVHTMKACELQEPPSRKGLHGARDAVTRVAYLPETKSTVSVGLDVIRVYSDGGGGQPVASFNMHQTFVCGVAVLRGTVMVSAELEEYEEQIFTWRAEASEGAVVGVEPMGMLAVDGVPTAVAPLGASKLIVGTMDGELFVVSHRMGANLRVMEHIEKAHSGWIDDIVVHGDVLLTRSTEQVKVWHRDSLQVMQLLIHEEPVFSAAIDDSRIVIGAADGKLYVRENKSLFPLEGVLHTHEGDLRSLALLDDDVVAVAGSIGCVGLIHMPSKTYIARLKISDSMLNAVASLGDGRIVVGGDDKFCQIITLPLNARHVEAECDGDGKAKKRGIHRTLIFAGLMAALATVSRLRQR